MSHTAWLFQRVVLAIALMIGFYTLALTVLAGLLWIPYAEYVYLNRIDLRIALACIAGAMAVFVALLPRRDRFAPPGPQLDEASEPRLFAFVRDIAVATRQSMPSEIYVVNEVNAWVAQRGGIMGFGGRRVMGIGLPLLQIMPPAEIRAVMAHEFGHYASSDVALGPWIYATRSAIARTVNGLQESWIGRPFAWYGRLFMRLTAVVSRRQEFVADQTSARVAGANVLALALRRIVTIAPAYAVYSQADVVPVLRAGFIPPVSEGFQQFVRTDQYQRLATRALEAAAEPTVDAFDTHPPLRERLAALGAIDDTNGTEGIAVDPGLLSDPDRYTRMLMAQAFGEEAVDALKPISWDRVADAVYVQQWRSFVLAHVQWLAPLTLETIPFGKAALVTFVQPMNIQGFTDNHQRLAYASGLFGAALAILMLDNGWRLERMPGQTPTLKKDDASLQPFETIEALATRAIDPQGWIAQCQRLGLSGPLLSAATIANSTALAAAQVQPTPAPQPAPSSRRRRSW